MREARHEHPRRTELDHVERFLDTLTPGLRTLAAQCEQWLLHRPLHGVARVERVVGVLEDDLELLPHRAELRLGEPGDIAALEDDGAARRRLEARDELA